MNNKTIHSVPSLSPGAAAFIEWINLSHPGALKGREGVKRNPYSCPRPRPFTVEDYFEGPIIDWCLEPANLREQLVDNMDWLCHSWRTTGEIYSALFRLVDPEEYRRQEGMEYLAESMSELGFRSAGEFSKPRNQVWYLPDGQC